MRPVSDEALDQIFRKARTHNAWLDQPVNDDVLRQLYSVMKWAPTSANLSPGRIVFLRTREAKERLRPALMPGNVDKTMAAPVTAIVAYDERFYEQAPRLFPHNPNMGQLFANSPELAEATAFRNGTLQGAYFSILAARAMGLDCGPMSGFDNTKVDAEFFSPAPDGAGPHLKPIGRLRSNFLCNLGYGDSKALFPRSPRLEFDEACQLL